ncbi:MAG: tRNA (adenosine(37)-N6)-threonylcarbamoyltransferase complex dimerization subunit type 1 TsaB [Gammaproteobacteria bacterium]|nr:tRNA (adenosine(37)-N6)-threonylcarbamoyltransferase complex dimerization subunit type 1 TsaB [Gammaproteobacteria bacterium]NNF59851.1 tRNA (adenosine(37)-N6)-threonylcarbamoyltransferase complex dimerization subunit type 1 TsaB [Gammaproteobacteria bacterium]NNM21275.1 tRNA (adenosine(37)-N6)-threonylcarbamoyltransferase complex dimerization subunit type 1 TsaB [Gammaproteobacteria bacterium]
MKILALDTATDACSAALNIDGEISERFEIAPRQHGQLILPMIEHLLTSAGLAVSQLDAVAFGRGPGAFTGVRIAAGVTQGISFAAGLPVIAVSDLAAVALAAAEKHRQERVLVCMDARMGEVYWSLFEQANIAQSGSKESLGAPETVLLAGPAFAAGSGWSAYPQMKQRLEKNLTGVDDELLPRAGVIARLAVSLLQRGDLVRPEQAIPVYLRDEVAWKKP